MKKKATKCFKNILSVRLTISIAVKLGEIDKVANLGRDLFDFVVAYVELPELRELVEALGQLMQLIRVEQQLLKRSVIADYVVRERGQILVPLIDRLDVLVAPGE